MELMWMAIGAAYALVGARAAVMIWRNEIRIGRHDRVFTFFSFLGWPALVLVVGLVVVLTGDLGIWEPGFRSIHAAPTKDK